jgi:uncharacterized NAD(P)/FAD-binding protein YdhS
MSTPEEIERMQAQLLERIKRERAAEYVIRSNIRLVVKAAVRQGCTWREVGEALGTTGQAAWERYGKTTPLKNRDEMLPFSIPASE